MNIKRIYVDQEDVTFVKRFIDHVHSISAEVSFMGYEFSVSNPKSVALAIGCAYGKDRKERVDLLVRHSLHEFLKVHPSKLDITLNVFLGVANVKANN